MVSASTPPSNATRPSRPEASANPGAIALWARPEAAFAVVTIALAALCGWILKHGYLDEEALSLYEKILVLSGAHPAKLEYLGLVYPHLPAYLVWAVHEIPGLRTPAAPYLASAVTAGCAVALWFGRQARHHAGFAWLAALLICANPIFLWTATTGSDYGLSLLLFFLLATEILRIIHDSSPQTFLGLSSLMALYFFADERALYVMVALVPLLPLFAPRALLERAPAALYLLVFTPFAMGFLAWAYLNWLYLGNPWHFLQATDSAFLGAAADVPYVPWLRDHGQTFVAPLFIALAMLLAGFPVLFWQVASKIKARKSAVTTLALIATILLATALSTDTDFLAHPLQMLFLVTAIVMVSLNSHPPIWARDRAIVLGLLALGIAGAWAVFFWEPSPDMVRWRTALVGRQVPFAHGGEAALGAWLAANREPTLIDDSLAYPAIVSRGDTRGLILPYMRAFKLDLSSQLPEVAQIVAPDPQQGRGASDAINERYPDLYKKGLPGFGLVYDSQGWRVYRQLARGLH